MTTQKDPFAVAMLLSAISSAVTYDDKPAALDLAHSGLLWANAKSSDEADDAWRQIELAAKWRAA